MPAPPLRARRTEIDGASLHWRDLGTGEPVLFLHGFPLSGEMWLPAIEQMGEGHRWIVPDLRGHGQSEATEVESLARYADDMAALLDAAGEPGPVVVVGLSMGGYVAFELCRRHPDRVRGLVLVDTRAEADDAEGARARLESAERALREGSAAVVDGMVEKLFAPAAPEALTERWREVMCAIPPLGLAAAQSAMAGRPDSMETLRSLQCPVLVVVGDEDAITPPAGALRMAEQARDARYIVVPGAGHMTPVEQPGRFALVLEEFLERLDG